MTDTPEAIGERARQVRRAGEELQAAGPVARVAWVCRTAERVLEEVRRSASLRRTLVEQTGLSEPMVSWAVETTLTTVNRSAVERVQSQVPTSGELAALDALIVAGNVFTAAVRAVLVPLAIGVPVVVKPSTGQAAFVRLIGRMLRETDPRLGNAMDIVEFEGGDDEREAALCAHADSVSVYGGDDTVAAIGSRLAPDTRLVRHGHGVSAAYVDLESIGEGTVESTTERLAVDIAAYDQRGCLSPQVLYVQSVDETQLASVADELSKALDALESKLPRGALPSSVAAAQTQWRGLAEIEGTLIRGATHALALLPRGPLSSGGPGYRNLGIVSVGSLDEALDSMGPFCDHLKCVGVPAARLQDVEVQFRSRSWSAYGTPIGRMQTPLFDAPADGRPVTEGLYRA